MSVVSKYKDIPVSSRVGAGSYTYKCVLESDETGIIKIEIFADSVDNAMYIAAMQFGNIASWSYINNDIISLILVPYPNGTCFLYTS